MVKVVPGIEHSHPACEQAGNTTPGSGSQDSLLRVLKGKFYFVHNSHDDDDGCHFRVPCNCSFFLKPNRICTLESDEQQSYTIRC